MINDPAIVAQENLERQKRAAHLFYGSGYWKKQSEACKQRDGYKCVACRARKGDVKLHAHHIIPYLDGGSSGLGNLVTLCSRCHAWEDYDYKMSNDKRAKARLMRSYCAS